MRRATLRGVLSGALTAFALTTSLPGQTIGNLGFENPVLGGTPFQYNPPIAVGQEWNFQGLSGVARSDPQTFQAVGTTDGQFGFLQFTGESASNISQPIIFSAAGSYQLSYLEAGRAFNGASGFGDLNYNVSIVPTGGGAAVLNTNDSSTTAQPFTATVYNFVIPSAGSYTLTFSAVTAPHGDDTTFFDNVAVTVPEPSLYFLMAAGGLTMALFRRWR